MAKLMCSRGGGIDAGALERMANDRPDATRPQKAADRGFGAQKYAAAGATRSSMPQIGGDRFADLRGQRQLECAGHLYRARSTGRCSNRCHRAREMPLRLNATPVARAGARWRSRDARSRYVDRYWPATGVPDPPQSRGGSTSSTSWPRSGTAAARSSVISPR